MFRHQHLGHHVEQLRLRSQYTGPSRISRNVQMCCSSSPMQREAQLLASKNAHCGAAAPQRVDLVSASLTCLGKKCSAVPRANAWPTIRNRSTLRYARSKFDTDLELPHDQNANRLPLQPRWDLRLPDRRWDNQKSPTSRLTKVDIVASGRRRSVEKQDQTWQT